ncbi:AAA family ATPase [Rhizobium sp. TRM96647]|uniref:AAA family ATPase n=1 Tax=unclassified Rhizobium TaxID=2613769 RepID=UPI0021E86B3B|nr:MULTISPECIES: AAA family ATPase [unclassified Rhizobium]MCV3737549.1 AAA family ATPase [Rhizobium sp. TRM96647]MCV3756361.1 AAA family ATPase [Rhizobium sp. TRM96650]
MTVSITIDEAAVRLRRAERVLVIGCSGSGKSTLARRLSGTLGLRHVPMDREIFWMPGWRMRPRDEALARLREVLAADAWIVDGTSPGTLPLRLPRSDLVIWMRPPRRVSLCGVLGRWLKCRGRTRPDMADGCPERISLEFLRYVWNFERTESPEIEARLGEHATVPVVVLRSRPEADRLAVAVATTTGDARVLIDRGISRSVPARRRTPSSH